MASSAVFLRQGLADPAVCFVPQASPRVAVSATTPLLSVRDLTLDYVVDGRVIRAVHRASFDVLRGDRTVLLGASGCGKSSLLKAVGGFLAPADGEIRLGGRAITGPGPDRMVVFQEFDQLPPWKTVLGNVMFPLRAARRSDRREAERRARDALERVGLARFADAYPHTLSGGMKQRVAIARALAMEPEILLMDEPFASLDALTRRRMQEELLVLADKVGLTLLFVTHSIEEALVIGTRIVVLSPHPGRVRAELDASAFGLDAVGGAAFQAQAQRIHRLLFDEAAA